MAATPKTRLDVLLVERALVPSRERARAYILAGRVLVNEQKIDKPGTTVVADAALRLLGDDMPYVSRGGLKLAAALAHWQIAVGDRDSRGSVAPGAVKRRLKPLFALGRPMSGFCLVGCVRSRDG